MTCPSLPGLVTYGETLEQARAMALDAIEGYLECLEEDGLPLPESDPVAVPPLVDQVRVELASKNEAAAAGAETPGGRESAQPC